MRKLQFSLLGLLSVVSFVAVGCAALAKPNEWWSMFVTNATFAALFVGVLAAIYGHAARRAFWVGFAVAGWGYLVVGWANGVLSVSRPDDAQAFVTTRLLEWLGERTLSSGTTRITSTLSLPAATTQMKTANITVTGVEEETLLGVPATRQGQIVQKYIVTQRTNSLAQAVDQQAMSRFMRIGHSLWAVVFAVAGGLLARAFHFRRERLAAREAP